MQLLLTRHSPHTPVGSAPTTFPPQMGNEPTALLLCCHHPLGTCGASCYLANLQPSVDHQPFPCILGTLTNVSWVMVLPAALSPMASPHSEDQGESLPGPCGPYSLLCPAPHGSPFRHCVTWQSLLSPQGSMSPPHPSTLHPNSGTTENLLGTSQPLARGQCEQTWPCLPGAEGQTAVNRCRGRAESREEGFAGPVCAQLRGAGPAGSVGQWKVSSSFRWREFRGQYAQVGV